MRPFAACTTMKPAPVAPPLGQLGRDSLRLALHCRGRRLLGCARSTATPWTRRQTCRMGMPGAVAGAHGGSGPTAGDSWAGAPRLPDGTLRQAGGAAGVAEAVTCYDCVLSSLPMPS